MDRLLDFDLEAFKAIHVGLHESWLDPVFRLITYTGLDQVLVPMILLLLVWPATKRFVWPLLFSWAIAGGLGAQGIKHLLPRDRPSNLLFAHPQEPIFLSSFPSGHTTISSACAFTILFMTWGTSQVKWGWLAVGWAVLVGVSRIYRGVHWPTDVLGGLCLGMCSASIVVYGFGKVEKLKA